MKKVIFAFFGLATLIPAAVSAQNFGYVDSFVNKGLGLLNLAVTIIMVAMTLWFLISVFNFIKEKDAAKMKDRKKQVINGLIGLFIAVGVWGIIRIAGSVFGVDTENRTRAPGIACPPGFYYDTATGQCRNR